MTNVNSKDAFDQWNRQISPLIYRIQQHDKLALRDLYSLAGNKLLGIIMRIVKDRHDAEEVLQDVFIKLWDRAQQYSGSGSAWGWLCVLTRHAALDRLRSSERHRHESTDEDQQLLTQLVSDWDITDEHSIKRCLQGLKVDMRQSILMAYVYGYSHSELAVQLEAPLGTVKAWVRRGLQELKLCLTA